MSLDLVRFREFSFAHAAAELLPLLFITLQEKDFFADNSDNSSNWELGFVYVTHRPLFVLERTYKYGKELTTMNPPVVPLQRI